MAEFLKGIYMNLFNSLPPLRKFQQEFGDFATPIAKSKLGGYLFREAIATIDNLLEHIESIENKKIIL